METRYDTAELLDGILEKIGDVRIRCPELRFGQLIAIVGQLAQAETGHSLWDVEDADFAAALERFANDLARREFSQAEPAAGSDRGGTSFSPGATGSESPRQVS